MIQQLNGFIHYKYHVSKLIHINKQGFTIPLQVNISIRQNTYIQRQISKLCLLKTAVKGGFTYTMKR